VEGRRATQPGGLNASRGFGSNPLIGSLIWVDERYARRRGVVLAVLLARILERGPVCVDGVSLTVIRKTSTELAFSVMPETYRQTTMGRCGFGSRVNLERSLRAEDRLSGHVVRGVVEGTGTLAARAGDGDAVCLPAPTCMRRGERTTPPAPTPTRRSATWRSDSATLASASRSSTRSQRDNSDRARHPGRDACLAAI
jgi:riboflavin synthase alpha subunit